MRISSRMAGVRGEGAFEVLVRARQLEAQGRSVVHMEIGEPDFPTAPHIVEAAKQALDAGYTKYGPTQGDPDLRLAIARHVSSSRGLDVGEHRVVVTPGAKPILFFSMLALLEPGDEAFYPNPGVPIYESMIRYTGATPVAMPLIESRGFSLDLDFLRDRLSDRTKLVILCSPQNPTGGVIPDEDLREAAALLIDRDLVVLADEIYSRIWFESKPFSIASIPGMLDKTILLDGFSKTSAMTGWRIGYGVLPEWLVAPVCLLMVNSASHTASFTQRAAIAALEGPQDQVTRMVDEFRRRRDLIVERLNQVPGIRCVCPGGAFYAFPNVEGVGLPARELADRLLNEAGVACLGGSAFGDYGEGYLRFSYATAYELVEQALDRIAEFIPKLRP